MGGREFTAKLAPAAEPHQFMTYASFLVSPVICFDSSASTAASDRN